MTNNSFVIRLIKRIYKLRLFNPIRKYVNKIKTKVEKSIRFELMIVIAICFGISAIFYAFSSDMLKNYKEVSDLKYNYDIIENNANNYFSKLQNNEGNEDTETKINKIIMNINNIGAKAYICTLEGKIIYKTNNVPEENVDVFNVISNMNNINEGAKQGGEKTIIFPIKIQEERYIFVYTDYPKVEIVKRSYIQGNSFLALVLTVIVFIIVFISITNKKMKYLDEIAKGLHIISNGDLEYRIIEEGNDEIRNLAFNINNMAEEVNNKIIAERRAEETKNELITNVSHDLRTPLTSIMGYIGLVKEGKYENDTQMMEYLNIAFNKSEKLKYLIEDLFEYTKVNNGGIKINKRKTNIAEFISQLVEELNPIFTDNELSVIKNIVEEKVYVNVDVDKMLRVFENLLSNAIKYSYKPGKIIVGVYREKDNAIVAIRNRGKHIDKEKVEKLFDRFYRVEGSRNEQTGGTGLGLAICKSIVKLHHGEIWAECIGENISFYVKLHSI